MSGRVGLSAHGFNEWRHSGYQHEINDGDKDKATFTAHHGLWRFIRTLFDMINRSKHVQTRDDFSVNSQITFCAPISRRCLHLLDIYSRTCGPLTVWNCSTVERECITETEKMLLRRLHRLLWSHNAPRQTWSVNESDRCNPWIKATYRRD